MTYVPVRTAPYGRLLPIPLPLGLVRLLPDWWRARRAARFLRRLQAVADAYVCSSCGQVGYGAGPCAGCNLIACYECARAEARVPLLGEFWFCPACSAARVRPRQVAS